MKRNFNRTNVLKFLERIQNEGDAHSNKIATDAIGLLGLQDMQDSQSLKGLPYKKAQVRFWNTACMTPAQFTLDRSRTHIVKARTSDEAVRKARKKEFVDTWFKLHSVTWES